MKLPAFLTSLETAMPEVREVTLAVHRRCAHWQHQKQDPHIEDPDVCPECCAITADVLAALAKVRTAMFANLDAVLRPFQP